VASLNSLTLEMKTPQTLKMMAATFPTAQHHTYQDLLDLNLLHIFFN